MKTETVNKIIDMAIAERKKSNVSGHEFIPSFGQPLGYHVYTVFDAAVFGEWFLPYDSKIESSNDIKSIREYIIETAREVDE